MAVCFSLGQEMGRYYVVSPFTKACAAGTLASVGGHLMAAYGLLGREVQKIERSLYAPFLYLLNIVLIALCALSVHACFARSSASRRVYPLDMEASSVSIIEAERSQGADLESSSHSDIITEETFFSDIE